jgi:hypothetical protein
VEVYLLVLQLALPQYDEPITGEIEMASFAECQERAALFLESFRQQMTDDGGEAMAGCVVKIARKQDATERH